MNRHAWLPCGVLSRTSLATLSGSLSGSVIFEAFLPLLQTRDDLPMPWLPTRASRSWGCSLRGRVLTLDNMKPTRRRNQPMTALQFLSMAVSQNKGTLQTPIYYNPFYGNPKKGTRSFGNSPNLWQGESQPSMNSKRLRPGVAEQVPRAQTNLI